MNGGRFCHSNRERKIKFIGHFLVFHDPENKRRQHLQEPHPLETRHLGKRDRRTSQVCSESTSRLRITGLQVRALPGVDQVLEPIYRRLCASKNDRQNELLAKVLPLLKRTPLRDSL